MKILSWNIQSGLGCDGLRDIRRLVSYIEDTYAPDVICLQEISRNIDCFSSAGQEDQCRLIAGLLPHYRYCWGSGALHYRADGRAEEYGNMTLVRGEILRQRVLPLPLPPAEGQPQIPRVAVEVLVPSGPRRLRIINTHHAFHHQSERALQLEYLTLQQQWAEHAVTAPPPMGEGAYAHHLFSPYTLMCGDFNFTPLSPEHVFLCTEGWRDAWETDRTQQPHPPTCGVVDHDAWPDGPHCRDYFWMSRDFPWRVEDLHADQQCQFSDHQPITITLV